MPIPALLGAALPSIIGGASSLGSSLLGGLFGNSQKSSDQRWQSAENAKDRQWQESFWQKQFNSENDEWSRRFDVENEYNNPSAQIARLKQAGINPAALLNEGGGLSSAGQGAANPSVQIPGVAGSHGVNTYAVPNPFASSSLSQMLDSFTKMKELGLETKRFDMTIGSIINNMNQNTKLMESQEFLNKVESWFKSTQLPKQIQAQVDKDIAQAVMFKAEGNLKEAEEKLIKAKERVENIKGDILDTNKAQFGVLIDAQIDGFRAGASQARAAAKRDLSQSETLDQTREHIVNRDKFEADIAKWQAKIADFEAFKKDVTLKSEINAAVNEYEKAGLINDELKQKIIKLNKENDTYGLRLMLDALKGLILVKIK